MSRHKDFTTLELELRSQLSEKRFSHSLAVAQTCLLLNERYKEHLDEDQMYLCGLLHDIVREWTDERLLSYVKEHQLVLEAEEMQYPVLLHAPVGAHFLSSLGYPVQLCTAVRYHTLGSVGMGRMGLVLYIADYLEPNRTHISEADREVLFALPSLDSVCLEILKRERAYLCAKGKPVSALSDELYRFLMGGGRL